ncbi:FAD-dependent oxidoreductase [Acuticoccus kandeliae]|uniref:FAD-dependent oxidoreductase n=1 Tax=Acuticoccus kandeliae TaxID=2073160 RepID=UPI000D3E7A26|nr:FAD-dependent oxidoreductase [Acuticoccus kandeliae]
MSVTSARAATGGADIDRQHPIAFTLEGRPLSGLAGDTIASALLANGIAEIAGVSLLGPDAPGALLYADGLPLQVDVPLVAGIRLTQDRPASPRLVTRRNWFARLFGRAPKPAPVVAPPAPEPSDHVTLHADIVVLGAGAAGLAAALTAARAGARVVLAEASPEIGGALRTLPPETLVDGRPADELLTRIRSALDQLDAVILTATLAVEDDGETLTLYRRAGSGGDLIRVHAAERILATGAADILPDAAAEIPGVMTARAALAATRRYGLAPGARASVVAAGPVGRDAAEALRAAGVEINLIEDAALAGTARGGRERDLVVIDAPAAPYAAPGATPWRLAGAAAGAASVGAALSSGAEVGAEAAGAIGFMAEARAMACLPDSEGPTLLAEPVPALSAPVPVGVAEGPFTGALATPFRIGPADDWHRRRAIFERAGDWLVPSAYPRAGERAEVAALREATIVREIGGISDISAGERFELKGGAAAACLDRWTLADATNLATGAVINTFAVDEAGRLAAPVRVLAMGPDQFEIACPPGETGLMDRLGAEEGVAVADLSDTVFAVALCGPDHDRLLARIVREPVPHLARQTVAWLRFDGGAVRLARGAVVGRSGVEIVLPARFGATVWERMVEEAEEIGATVFGAEAMRILRVEDGLFDIPPGMVIDPSEIGAGYAPMPAANGAARALVGLLPQGRHAPAIGDRVTGRAGAPVGIVVASCPSPILKRRVALALVEGGRTLAGSTLSVARAAGRPIKVQVVSPRLMEVDA